MNNTKIFLDRGVYQEAKLLAEDVDSERVEASNCLYQLRQIRSKFTEIETFEKLRATFDVFNTITDQPLTICTLCNHNKAVPSENGEPYLNYTLGSKLFMKIATEVFSARYKAHLEKDVVESIFLGFMDKKQKIPLIIRKIMDIYDANGVERIRILYKHELNRILVKLANILAPCIAKANKEVTKNSQTSLSRY